MHGKTNGKVQKLKVVGQELLPNFANISLSRAAG